MENFLGWVLIYIVKAIFIGLFITAGLFLGKFLRIKKDNKIQFKQEA